MQGCQCTILSPQLLLLLASKIACRSAIPAARCATARRLSSGVTLVSPRGGRTKGLPMAKGGVVKTADLDQDQADCWGGPKRAAPGAPYPALEGGGAFFLLLFFLLCYFSFFVPPPRREARD